MKTKKNSKKQLILLIFLLLLIGMICAGGYMVYRRFPQIRYYAKEFFYQLKPKDLPKQTDDVALTEISLTDLLNDPRVSFDQSMMLINSTYTLPEDFIPDTGEYKDSGVIMNNCLMDAYADIAAEVGTQFGKKLYIRSAYRTAEEQQEQLDTRGDAIAAAVGASEHQAGLGLDVYVPYYAGAAFIQDPAGQWVNTSCGDYGFIIRYPYYGEKETGTGYEPWHLRYVGFPHAQLIMENRLTLEGYMELFKVGSFYRYGSYLISRQTGESFQIPADFTSAVISPDNCGNYFLTFNCS